MIDALVRSRASSPSAAGGLAGWAVASPWGAGVAICARDEDAGVALLGRRGRRPGVDHDRRARSQPAAAGDALGRWGFARPRRRRGCALGRPSPGSPRGSSACSTCSGANAAKDAHPGARACALCFNRSRLGSDRRRGSWSSPSWASSPAAWSRRGAGAAGSGPSARAGAPRRSPSTSRRSRAARRSRSVPPAERVADVLADVAARTAATTRPSERDDLEIARLARDRRR